METAGCGLQQVLFRGEELVIGGQDSPAEPFRPEIDQGRQSRHVARELYSGRRSRQAGGRHLGMGSDPIPVPGDGELGSDPRERDEPMTRLRWGLLGTARINRALIPVLQAVDRAIRSTRWPSRALDRARAYAAEWNIPRATGSYEALLADSDRRRHLHLAAQQPPRRVDGPRARRGQARALREAPRAHGGRRGPDRGGRRLARGPSRPRRSCTGATR